MYGPTFDRRAGRTTDQPSDFLLLTIDLPARRPQRNRLCVDQAVYNEVDVDYA